MYGIQNGVLELDRIRRKKGFVGFVWRAFLLHDEVFKEESYLIYVCESKVRRFAFRTHHAYLE